MSSTNEKGVASIDSRSSASSGNLQNRAEKVLLFVIKIVGWQGCE